MKFKNWIFNEEGNAEQDDMSGGGSDDGLDWDLIYPTTAGNYVYDIKNPKWFWWLQWRWKRGEEIGRPLHNIDRDIFKWNYVSPYSTSLPEAEAGSGFWKHKDDAGRSSIGVAIEDDLVRIGVNEKPGEALVMHGPRISHGMDSDPKFPPADLKKIFGDDFVPTNKMDNPNR